MRALGAQGRCAPSRLTVHLVPRRGNAGRAPVSRFEVDVTGHYQTLERAAIRTYPVHRTCSYRM